MTDSATTAPDLAALEARRHELRERFLRPPAELPESTGGGVHHLALICADPERTIRVYQDVLGFPLVELFENRDYEGSSHFFFDIGAGNMLAFFDFPGLGLEPAPMQPDEFAEFIKKEIAKWTKEVREAGIEPQ